jgi:hypothetical protein
MTAYSAADWEGCSSPRRASAALAGLLFVAVSINLTKILEVPGRSGRAGEAIVLLVAVLVVSTLGSVQGQSPTMLSAELYLVGLLDEGGIGRRHDPGQPWGRGPDPEHRTLVGPVLEAHRRRSGNVTHGLSRMERPRSRPDDGSAAGSPIAPSMRAPGSTRSCRRTTHTQLRRDRRRDRGAAVQRSLAYATKASFVLLGVHTVAIDGVGPGRGPRPGHGRLRLRVA